MRNSLIAALVLGLSTLAAAQNASQTGAPWDYLGRIGPLNWGKLDPAYSACSKGHAQSPVNIHKAKLDKALKPIQFHYIGGPVTLMNDGHAIEVQVAPGSYIVAGGVRYNLEEFTFHHPSEHAVDGDLYDMEVDFLHRSADGKLAMIAVLLNENQDFPNAVLSTLWRHLPGKAGETEKITDVMVNPGGLFPTDPGYWTYTGSLPAPPCTEGVQWFVYETPVNISRTQLNAFTSIFKMNTRPLQSLHGRRITASE